MNKNKLSLHKNKSSHLSSPSVPLQVTWWCLLSLRIHSLLFLYYKMSCPIKLDYICSPYLLQNFKVSPKNLISHSNQPKLGLPIMNTLCSSTSSISNNATPYQIPTFFGNRDDDIFVHQDLTPPAAHFFPNVAIDNVADILYDHNSSLDGNQLNCADPFMVNLLHPRWKKPDVNYSSKHRQRKIVTAQGPRDRRVRLSIQIARQFFDLQDTLGFDKASKTLEWLLTKSKSAIEEAVKMKHSSNAAIEQEKVTEAAEIGDNFERSSSVISSTNYTTSCNFNVVTKKERLMRQQIHSNYLVAKELRAKARERARERTKAKISFRKLKEFKKLGSDFGHINFPTTWNYQLSSHSMVPYFNTYQQNYASSKQVPIDSPTTMENWEISNNFWQESAISTADLQYVYGGRLYMPVATSS